MLQLEPFGLTATAARRPRVQPDGTTRSGNAEAGAVVLGAGLPEVAHDSFEHRRGKAFLLPSLVILHPAQMSPSAQKFMCAISSSWASNLIGERATDQLSLRVDSRDRSRPSLVIDRIQGTARQP